MGKIATFTDSTGREVELRVPAKVVAGGELAMNDWYDRVENSVLVHSAPKTAMQNDIGRDALIGIGSGLTKFGLNIQDILGSDTAKARLAELKRLNQSGGLNDSTAGIVGEMAGEALPFMVPVAGAASAVSALSRLAKPLMSSRYANTAGGAGTGAAAGYVYNTDNRGQGAALGGLTGGAVGGAIDVAGGIGRGLFRTSKQADELQDLIYKKIPLSSSARNDLVNMIYKGVVANVPGSTLRRDFTTANNAIFKKVFDDYIIPQNTSRYGKELVKKQSGTIAKAFKTNSTGGVESPAALSIAVKDIRTGLFEKSPVLKKKVNLENLSIPIDDIQYMIPKTSETVINIPNNLKKVSVKDALNLSRDVGTLIREGASRQVKNTSYTPRVDRLMKFTSKLDKELKKQSRSLKGDYSKQLRDIMRAKDSTSLSKVFMNTADEHMQGKPLVTKDIDKMKAGTSPESELRKILDLNSSVMQDFPSESGPYQLLAAMAVLGLSSTPFIQGSDTPVSDAAKNLTGLFLAGRGASSKTGGDFLTGKTALNKYLTDTARRGNVRKIVVGSSVVPNQDSP